jgi:hypothetical protein
MPHRFSWFGAGLVVVGVLLLLHRLGYVPFGWHTVFWGVVALAGAFKMYRSFIMKRRGGAFWGTILFVLGTLNVLDEVNLFTLDHPFVPAVIFLTVGMGFLLSYSVEPNEWHVLVPCAIFLALGGVMLLSEMGYLYQWDVEDFIRKYWPAALILFGGSLLLNRQSAH